MILIKWILYLFTTTVTWNSMVSSLESDALLKLQTKLRAVKEEENRRRPKKPQPLIMREMEDFPREENNILLTKGKRAIAPQLSDNKVLLSLKNQIQSKREGKQFAAKAAVAGAKMREQTMKKPDGFWFSALMNRPLSEVPDSPMKTQLQKLFPHIDPHVKESNKTSKFKSPSSNHNQTDKSRRSRKFFKFGMMDQVLSKFKDPNINQQTNATSSLAAQAGELMDPLVGKIRKKDTIMDELGVKKAAAKPKSVSFAPFANRIKKRDRDDFGKPVSRSPNVPLVRKIKKKYRDELGKNVRQISRKRKTAIKLPKIGERTKPLTKEMYNKLFETKKGKS